MEIEIPVFLKLTRQGFSRVAKCIKIAFDFNMMQISPLVQMFQRGKEKKVMQRHNRYLSKIGQ